MSHLKKNQGFTLLELIVALGVFTVVMFIAVSSLLATLSVYKKVQASKNVMDNLSFAIEGIARNMRVGFTYHCDDAQDALYVMEPQDCVGDGGDFISFTRSQDGIRTAYRFFEVGGRGRIERSINCETLGCGAWQSITAPDVDINTFNTRVIGTSPSDGAQPLVFLIVQGVAGVKDSEKVEFSIQTTISQRPEDI